VRRSERGCQDEVEPLQRVLGLLRQFGAGAETGLVLAVREREQRSTFVRTFSP
jgi:hypothetical protein